ncbi:MAG: polysaccharide biosynthesis protein [Rhodospirillaceae bacterium]|nr:polysaccharide biosynthesis protein [Rhodospirillaceae bacterium]MBT7267733.1 polysaccharide biosynthesis protein [Rhodospirillaceae bacterium]
MVSQITTQHGSHVLKIYNRANIAFFHDVIMASLSFVIALFLRLGSDIEFYSTDQLLLATGLFTGVAAIVFRAMRMYRGVWRYASLNDLLNITKSASLVILIFLVLLFMTTRLEDLPRSLPFINWFVLIALLGGPRFLYRLFKDRRLEFKLDRNTHQRIPVLLVGAGDSAELFIRDLARSDANYRVAGIVSGTEARVGRDIHGVEILGTIEQIPTVFKDLSRLGPPPQRLIVTSERIEGLEIRSLLDTADTLGMTLARLPALTDFKQGVGAGNEIAVRPIDVEDLLGRPQTALDREAMEKLILGKRVLITGAGGSIGSELVRQISDLAPASIALVENSEFNLYSIDMELSKRHSNLAREALIGDIRDRPRIDHIFAETKPELVFHAAALKHVPMVEANILEGLTTNVLGTMNVADAARAAGVTTFVQISTDKAVNPTNVMGASKRMAESYCQAIDLEGGTRFVTVRFGNVLGSTGSVVELFRKQISEGGPVTVTDPEMKRYFMTVREAVELVLAASALGSTQLDQAGKIYVLEMGEPVLILDLAKQMIRLAGRVPEEDIEIIYTGLRPGEKLFEEIFHGSEELGATQQSGILLAAPRLNDLAVVRSEITALSHAIEANDQDAARAVILNLVPEYNPSQNS